MFHLAVLRRPCSVMVVTVTVALIVSASWIGAAPPENGTLRVEEKTTPSIPTVPSIPIIPAGSAYRQTNLISDWPGLAPIQDPLLVNPWGTTLTGTSPFWVSNSGSGTATLYRGDVGSSPFVKNPAPSFITIPGNRPTGVVTNTTTD